MHLRGVEQAAEADAADRAQLKVELSARALETLSLSEFRRAQLSGDVRRRMAGHFDRLLEAVMRTAEREAANGGKFEGSRALAARYRTLVLQGPELEAAAAALASDAPGRP